ncbi:MAG: hypothetical protein COV91_00565 [Candidatus Taylorbacteria bacterium CG11_big_fil_rev_8_21_14_0_20_46_11]|uniref:3-phosphoshikimate 1-carboxyvinyltransferase n=1 Tax=Candidatus Taylorbacteria bacterium CG11_big_fil_rev_8_21_14_0_20_46_11 TaxID=1975025 RepID=A0A2H0KCX6_9BACT|nr:MAG: hypothetical protein COV91_00565 [Candidatus Taylorbacteria bacterium CG11_big_fil_rev_8_21_14_0_20_46_11]
MKLVIRSTKEISGEATPPSSKSEMIRGLILATLAKGTSALKNPLHSQDTVDAIRACRGLGANIMVRTDRVIVESRGVPLQSETTVNTGNSGVTTHFLLPVLGLRGEKARPVTLDCGDQMKARPVESLVSALQRLGMKLHVQPQRGKKNISARPAHGKGQAIRPSFPLQISSELFGGKAGVSGVSSQYLSALLMSLPCAKNDSVITVDNLEERPYVEMTEAWLNEQGIVYEHKKEDLRFQIKDLSKTTTTSAPPRLTDAVHFSHSEDRTLKVLRSSKSSLLTPSKEVEKKSQATRDVYTIKGGQAYKPFIKMIPGDFSSASYLITAGVLFSGTVVLHGLDMQCPQGDKELVTILQKMGADIRIEGDTLTITGGKELTGMTIDANAIPDIVPTLAVIGTQATGTTEIVNVANARLKETDRLRSMTEGLSEMGGDITEHTDGLTVRKSVLHGASVKGYNDHRTVMALSLAGMLADGETLIDTAEAINKTFPNYVEMMRSLGAKMRQK